jgi:hypothetical protein
MEEIYIGETELSMSCFGYKYACSTVIFLQVPCECRWC